MHGSAGAGRRCRAAPGRLEMAAALLDEFGTGDARERAEAWRYSRNALTALDRIDFAPARRDAPTAADLVARFDWTETAGRRIVFVNGAWSARHSAIDESGPLRIEQRGQTTKVTLDQDDAAVHVVHVSVPGPQAGRWSAELHLRVAARRVRVIEQHVGADGRDVLASLRSRVEIAANADLTSATLCDLPGSVSLVRRREVQVDAGGSYSDLHALFGGRLQRHDLVVRLAGVGARYAGRGVFVLGGRQHADVHLDVKHATRDTASDVLWRGVADQRARGILHGAITVAAGADGADARLQTKNLLLSPHAEIDAQPALEIHADEVKASHGATVGQLDERALFYMRTRGIPAATARRLLITGFCREVVAEVESADLRARIETVLGARLPQSAQHPETA